MGLKDFFGDVLEDSEEELKADIREAKELIRERERQLDELVRRKMQRQAKTAPVKRQKLSPKPRILKVPSGFSMACS